MPRSPMLSRRKRDSFQADPAHESLWDIFQHGLNEDALIAVTDDQGQQRKIEEFSIGNPFARNEDGNNTPIKIHHVRAERALPHLSKAPCLTNVVIVDDIAYDDLINDHSIATLQQRHKQKSFFKRHKVSLDNFLYELPIDKIIHAVSKSVENTYLNELPHEIFIPIVHGKNKIIIRLLVKADMHVAATQILISHNESMDGKLIDVKTLRKQLAESLGWDFEFSASKVRRIRIQRHRNIFTKVEFWKALAHDGGFIQTDDNPDKEIHPDHGSFYTPREVISNRYIERLDERDLDAEENSNRKGMAWLENTPKIYLKTQYEAPETTWENVKNSKIFNRLRIIRYAFRRAKDENQTGANLLNILREMIREDNRNYDALGKKGHKKSDVLGLLLGVVVGLVIAGIITVASVYSLPAIPAILLTFKMAFTHPIVLLGLEKVATILAFAAPLGAIVGRFTFPMLGKLIKYPFIRRFEEKKRYTLEQKNYEDIHRWRRKRNYVPNDENAYLTNDMMNNFVETKKLFLPLFTFVHSQFKRWTVLRSAPPHPYYEQPASYWANLRRQIKKGYIDNAMQVLEFHVTNRTDYITNLKKRYESGNTNADGLVRIFEQIFEEMKAKYCGQVIAEGYSNYDKLEALLTRCLKMGRKQALRHLDEHNAGDGKMDGFGLTEPTFSSKEKFAEFSAWWSEYKRLQIINECLDNIDREIICKDTGNSSYRDFVRKMQEATLSVNPGLRNVHQEEDTCSEQSDSSDADLPELPKRGSVTFQDNLFQDDPKPAPSPTTSYTSSDDESQSSDDDDEFIAKAPAKRKPHTKNQPKRTDAARHLKTKPVDKAPSTKSFERTETMKKDLTASLLLGTNGLFAGGLDITRSLPSNFGSKSKRSHAHSPRNRK